MADKGGGGAEGGEEGPLAALAGGEVESREEPHVQRAFIQPSAHPLERRYGLQQQQRDARSEAHGPIVPGAPEPFPRPGAKALAAGGLPRT